MADKAFPQRQKIGLPEAEVTVTEFQEQLHRARQEPNRGWPAHVLMYPLGDPADVDRDPIFISKNYWDLDPDYCWVTGAPMEPLTRALALAGAVRVDAGDFRALGANAGLLRPLVGRGRQLRALTGRKARDGKECHDWQLGVKLGLTASGELPQRTRDLPPTRPGIRKSGLRDVMDVLRRKGQAGHPPIVATDAQLGYSVAPY